MNSAIKNESSTPWQRNRLKAGLGVGSICLIAAACGGRVDAVKATLNICYAANSGGGVDMRGSDSNKPISNIADLQAKASDDILSLQRRALMTGGIIDLPDHWNTEIEATKDKVIVAFPPGSGGIPNPYATDNVIFKITNGTVNISPGAIACSDKSAVYANNVFTNLEHYVAETAGLN